MFTKDLKALAQSSQEDYENAKPFPHLVIDGLFDSHILKKAASSFPTSDSIHKNEWRIFNDGPDGYEKKQTLNNIALLPNDVKKVLSALNSDEFVTFLQDLLDIPTLEKDDTFRGAGLHEITKGGRLGIHIDFSKGNIKRTQTSEPSGWRRANCLLYLNEEWKDSYKGHLQLYDNNPDNGGKLTKSILPIFNRLVIFGTSIGSWHGHPEPLNCPLDRRRISLAAYYYSEEQGSDHIKHGTIFAEGTDE